MRLVVLLLFLGFPVAVVLAWAYELTAEGIKRTDEVDPRQSTVRTTGRKLDFVIIGILLVVIAFLSFRQYGPNEPQPPVAVRKRASPSCQFADL